MGNDATRKIKSVERAIEILGFIRMNRGATVSEISEHVALSPGTVSTYLSTLKSHGFVHQDGRSYQIGNHFITMGDYVRNRETLFKFGHSVVNELANDTGEVSHLIVEDNGFEIILYEAFGEHAVGEEFYITNRGRDNHLHYSAAGKAMLAHFDNDKMRSIIKEHDLVQRTSKTITTIDALHDELAEIREQGYAQNDEEAIKGLRAVGAPVMSEDDEVIGAISLSAPVERLQGEAFHETIPTKVREAANIIQVNIQANAIG